MEQRPDLSTILCITLLIFTWGQAAVAIPTGCKRGAILNSGASTEKAGGLRVSQKPRSLSLTAGETMTLNCTFEYKNITRAKVFWLRGLGEDTVLDSNHPFYQGRLNVSSLNEIRQGKAMLTLSRLEERDAGFYHCCLEIENKGTGMGGGTELRVTHRNLSVADNKMESQCEPSTNLTIYKAGIAVAGAGVILLAGALVLCRFKAATTETQLKEPSKRERRSASDMSEGLHYAEITVKARAQTEYASVGTKQL